MIERNYILDFLALVISVSAFILGFYSFKYNQDFHHWGLQLSYLIDYKNGFSFFQDIYLQYGQGQTLFLFIIDKYAGAQNIINELKIINTTKKK